MPCVQSVPFSRARRCVDLFLALQLLLFAAPIMAIVAAAVYFEDGGPIIFAHSRIGLNGKAFPCLKFRSMKVDAAQILDRLLAQDESLRREWAENQKLRHDPRVTKVGFFIRKYSLDELPQLINILLGDMRLVGPRPIVSSEIVHYGRRIKYYYSVRPGLTGLWQVSGRSGTTYRSRVAMDTLYARKQNASLDLRILMATVPAVLLGRGAH